MLSAAVTVAQTADTDSMSIFSPDFAYPASVIKTASDYLDENPASQYPERRDPRLLAAEELAVATLDIDKTKIGEVLGKIFELAKAEKKSANQALLQLYAAELCNNYGHYARGYVSKPDPAKVSVWNARACKAAVDSLCKKALNYSMLIDDNTNPLTAYSLALRIENPKASVLKTVRDFIKYRVGSLTDRQNYGNQDKPYAIFKNTQEINSDSVCRATILQHIDEPGLEYRVAAYLMRRGATERTARNLDFLKRVQAKGLPEWITPFVDICIRAIEAPEWMLSADHISADTPAKLTLSSTCTDSVAVWFYRFKTPAELYKVSEKYIGRASTNDMKEVFKARYAKYLCKRVVMKGNPTLEKRDTTYLLTLPAGNYIAYSPDSNEPFAFFDVSPWQVGFIQTTPEIRMVQVLDAQSGRPVSHVRVIAETAVEEINKKTSKIKATSDSDGIVRFDRPIQVDITVTDPKTGIEIFFNSDDVNYSWTQNDPADESDYSDDDESIRIRLSTDRTVYHPGDTLRWLAVLQDSRSTVEGRYVRIDGRLPDSSGRGNVSVYGANRPTAGPSDSFGRIDGTFVIPADCKPGRATFSVGDVSVWFNVSDFKLPELWFGEQRYILRKDSVELTGVLCNSVGAPRADIPVVLRLNGRNDTTRTDDKGRYSFIKPRFTDSAQLKNAMNFDINTWYTVEASTPDGYSASESGSFPVFKDCSAWVESSDVIDTRGGVSFVIKTERLGVEDAKQADAPVECRWSIVPHSDYWLEESKSKPVLEGTAMTGTVILPQAFTDTVSAGIYRIVVKPLTVPGYETWSPVTLYDSARPGLPVDDPVWLPKYDYNVGASDSVNVEIGVRNDSTILWWTSGEGRDIPVRYITLDKGYHTVTLPCAGVGSLMLWCVRDGLQWNRTIQLNSLSQEAADRLTLSLEQLRERTEAGTKQHWTVVTRMDNKPVEAAVLVNVYDKRLDALGAPRTLTLIRLSAVPYVFNHFKVSASSAPWTGPMFMQIPSGYVQTDILNRLLFPQWRYGATTYGVSSRLYNSFTSPKASAKARSKGDTSMRDAKLAMVVEEGIVETAGAAPGAGTGTDKVKVRRNTLFNALWQPLLTTDSRTGTVDVDYMLPNQATTWKVYAAAWTRDLEFFSLSRTFVASKPLTVKPNMPRFVRAGDRVSIVTAITNETDSALNVAFDVTVNNGSPRADRIEVAARSTALVSTMVDVTGETALADSLSFTFRATNGTYGDGECVVIPVLPSSALLTESTPFYLNPGQESIAFTLPTDNGDATVRNEIYYVANPMWPLVESVAECLKTDPQELVLSTQLAQRWYVGVTVRKLVAAHPELSGYVDVPDIAPIAARLDDLQFADGGFAWGKWSRVSSLHTTLAVLSWLDDDRDDPTIRKMAERALRYVDANIATESSAPRTVNLTYSVIRSAFGRPDSPVAQRVIANTVNHVSSSWKSMSLGDKCLAALLMCRTGKPDIARDILASVSQYGVIRPDRGIVFPNMPGVVGLANMLQAYGMAAPEDTSVIDAVRQALLCQRRGQSWGNDGHAAYATRALASTGTEWLVPAGHTSLRVDGRAVDIPASERLCGAFTAIVDGSDIVLSRKPATTPAYGSVVSKRVAPLNDVAAFGTGQLSIVKTLYAVDADGNRIDALRAKGLSAGQKIIVSLRVYTDSDMTDVCIADARSATLEPVAQTGRYVRTADGTWYFMQPSNRETRVYVDSLRRGYTVFEYETTVNNAGVFTTGIATVTSSLDETLTAHSASTLLNVAP